MTNIIQHYYEWQRCFKILVFQVELHVALYTDIDVSDATSLSRSEVCSLKNRFGHTGRFEELWSERRNITQYPTCFSYEGKGIFLRNVGIRVQNYTASQLWSRNLIRKRCKYLETNTQLSAEVVTVVITSNSTAFWDAMPCSLVEFYENLGGTCRYHLRAQRMSR
jgi:hypothetical protein